MLDINIYNGLVLAGIQAKSFQGHSYNGLLLPAFTLAVATGVITITLTQTGLISPVGVGTGVSTGVGIIISGANISSNIRSSAVQLFGSEGPSLKDFTDAIGLATQAHFATASLLSDTNGTAAYPAFIAAIPAMTALIIASAPAFVGPLWPAFAQAIATGICQEIATNGTSVLAGAVAPGTGTGIVTIS